MQKEQMKIVIIGHVDHGKSTLTGRLLYDTNSLPEGVFEEVEKISKDLGREVEFAFILDSLEEEREQNVTIDTTQIFFKTEKREYLIIDAPGHKQFLKNMITGASLAEAAIIMIDANEGVSEQTKRHAAIISLIGIKKVMVIINKMDIVNYDEKIFNNVSEDIKGFLKKIEINPIYIIPASAKTGENISKKSSNLPWYKGLSFLEALDSLEIEEKSIEKPMRFSVQDVYRMDNQRIIVGKIESGTINIGDSIFIFPNGMKTKIREIKDFGKEKTSAVAGESIGIVIEDPLFIERGNIISKDKLVPNETIKSKIFWMNKMPLKLGEQITLKCSTQETKAEIKEIEKVIDSSTLEPLSKKEVDDSEVAFVNIKPSKNIFFEKFSSVPELGRFVIERDNIVGGGIVI